jgi:hypothetical protein
MNSPHVRSKIVSVSKRKLAEQAVVVLRSLRWMLSIDMPVKCSDVVECLEACWALESYWLLQFWLSFGRLDFVLVLQIDVVVALQIIFAAERIRACKAIEFLRTSH